MSCWLEAGEVESGCAGAELIEVDGTREGKEIGERTEGGEGWEGLGRIKAIERPGEWCRPREKGDDAVWESESSSMCEISVWVARIVCACCVRARCTCAFAILCVLCACALCVSCNCVLAFLPTVCL